MHKFMVPALLLAVAGFASGCATSGTSQNGNALLRFDKGAGMATQEGGGSKMGEACAQNVMMIVATGDASIEAAKKQGGISRVVSVDYVYNNYVVYGKTCTIVRGN